MNAIQETLPFENADFTSILKLDDSAILDGSLAIAGFDWDGLRGEVFEDGGIRYYDGDEFSLDNSSWSFYPTDKEIIAFIKRAHDVKVGKITEEQ